VIHIKNNGIYFQPANFLFRCLLHLELFLAYKVSDIPDLAPPSFATRDRYLTLTTALGTKFKTQRSRNVSP